MSYPHSNLTRLAACLNEIKSQRPERQNRSAKMGFRFRCPVHHVGPVAVRAEVGKASLRDDCVLSILANVGLSMPESLAGCFCGRFFFLQWRSQHRHRAANRVEGFEREHDQIDGTALAVEIRDAAGSHK